MPARRSANLLWLLAVVVGTALRLYQLRDQVLVDDEWHALHALLAGGPLDVLLSFGSSDHSIPLTLYDILLERSVGLSELGMRLPALLAGLAALIVIPWLVRDLVGARASVLLAWLLAISPLHVFYSRYARPYELAMLLSCVALLAFRRWERGDGRGWVVTYVACAVLAPWLLLVVLPVVAAPPVLAMLHPLGGRSARASRAVTTTALAVLAGWTLCLAPPLVTNLGALSEKVARGSLDAATLPGASELLLGTTSVWLRLACLAAAALGAYLLAHRQRRFALLVALAGLLQIAGLIVLQPNGLRFPIVFARYLFALSPFLLLMLAVGLDAIAGASAARVRSLPYATLPAAAVLALLLLGPLPWIDVYPNDFTNHGSYQADYDPGRYFERFRPTVIPDFYAQLAQRPPGSVTIVEAPWHFFWHGLAYDQRIHRQHVVVGFVDRGTGTVRGGEVPRDRSGIRLRNALYVGDDAALRVRGADYVIFHHDALTEMHVPFAAAAVDVTGWVEEYRRRYGEPVYQDGTITVFAVRPG